MTQANESEERRLRQKNPLQASTNSEAGQTRSQLPLYQDSASATLPPRGLAKISKKTTAEPVADIRTRVYPFA